MSSLNFVQRQVYIFFLEKSVVHGLYLQVSEWVWSRYCNNPLQKSPLLREPPTDRPTTRVLCGYIPTKRYQIYFFSLTPSFVGTFFRHPSGLSFFKGSRNKFARVGKKWRFSPVQSLLFFYPRKEGLLELTKHQIDCSFSLSALDRVSLNGEAEEKKPQSKPRRLA